jgi:hypothetical protein
MYGDLLEVLRSALQGKRKQSGFVASEVVVRMFQEVCAEQGRSMSDQIERLMWLYLRDYLVGPSSAAGGELPARLGHRRTRRVAGRKV